MPRPCQRPTTPVHSLPHHEVLATPLPWLYVIKIEKQCLSLSFKSQQTIHHSLSVGPCVYFSVFQVLNTSHHPHAQVTMIQQHSASSFSSVSESNHTMFASQQSESPIESGGYPALPQPLTRSNTSLILKNDIFAGKTCADVKCALMGCEFVTQDFSEADAHICIHLDMHTDVTYTHTTTNTSARTLSFARCLSRKQTHACTQCMYIYIYSAQGRLLILWLGGWYGWVDPRRGQSSYSCCIFKNVQVNESPCQSQQV